jgi:hypothetical protein
MTLIYVPRDAADIALADPSEYAQLDQLIESEPCVRTQRGRLMERNSCREPWVTVVTARTSKHWDVWEIATAREHRATYWIEYVEAPAAGWQAALRCSWAARNPHHLTRT